jgi:phosphoribosylamine--glycine ligase
MKILVVGGGGREHALVWAMARHGHEIVAAPGNPGIAEVARCAPIAATDLDGQVSLGRDADLVVVGPEAPLVAGLADRCAAAGVRCFGPGAAGARLEGSKAWSKRFFARHGIPTAEFAVATTPDEVEEALARLGGAVVVKADGLAAGKGVVVCGDVGQARAAASALGLPVVVERRLDGREASIMALSDGKRFVVLPPAEDHKAIFDGDQGPNTGGMGAVSPTPVVTPELLERIERAVLAPTVAGLRQEGIDYRGVLYAGLMIAPDGTPNVLEYNCRFGDPEVEAVLARWDDDPAAWLDGVARGALPWGAPRFRDETAVCVVMSAAGYPGTPRTGDPIRGLERTRALVFHAATRRAGAELVTAGGRVLAVTALGADLAAARDRAYAAVAEIDFAGAHFRRDIGARH